MPKAGSRRRSARPTRRAAAGLLDTPAALRLVADEREKRELARNPPPGHDRRAGARRPLPRDPDRRCALPPRHRRGDAPAVRRAAALVLGQPLHRLGPQGLRPAAWSARSSATRSGRTSPAASRPCWSPPPPIRRCCATSTTRCRPGRTRGSSRSRRGARRGAAKARASRASTRTWRARCWSCTRSAPRARADGAYTQADVTAFAAVLTGWRVGPRSATADGNRFDRNWHEPGRKTVLGKSYPEGPEALLEVLRDLARHPATARFVATKLARHFVADEPPPALVDRLAAVYLKSDGQLGDLYRELIHHEAAWSRAPAQAEDARGVRRLDGAPARRRRAHVRAARGQRRRRRVRARPAADGGAVAGRLERSRRGLARARRGLEAGRVGDPPRRPRRPQRRRPRAWPPRASARGSAPRPRARSNAPPTARRRSPCCCSRPNSSAAERPEEPRHEHGPSPAPRPPLAEPGPPPPLHHRPRAVTGSLAAWPTLTLAGAAGPGGNRLVLVILRGGLDGLGAAPAVGDADFAAARGPLGQYAAPPLRVDATFALHPQPGRAACHGRPAARRRSSTPSACPTASARTSTPSRCWKAAAPGRTSCRPAGSAARSAASGSKGLALNTAVPLVLRGRADVDTWAPSVLPDPSADLVARLERMYAGDPALATRARAGAPAPRRHAGGDAGRGAGDDGRQRRRARGAFVSLAASRRRVPRPAERAAGGGARDRRLGHPCQPGQSERRRSPPACASSTRPGGAAHRPRRRRRLGVARS